MRKTLALAVILAVFALVTLTAGTAIASKGGNVYKTDEDGTRHAVCGCGMKMAVTDETPTVEIAGETYYACSEMCAGEMKKAGAQAASMFDVKVMQAKAGDHMLGNVTRVEDDGTMYAMCSCGMEVKVTDKSVSRMHEGDTYYMCSEKCAEMFDKNPEMLMKKVQSKMSSKTMKKDCQMSGESH